jgi:hypothetical protein
MKSNQILTAMLVATTAAFAPIAATAEEAHVAPVKEFISANVEAWLTDPVVVGAIKEQNAKTSGLSQADVDKLDQDWRAQATAADKPFVNEVLARELSKFLMEKKEGSEGMITEMFVMDAKGLNVGQSDVTSDYIQGDEDKWQKTYPVGPDAVFIDEVEFDDSSGHFQSQANVTVTDPATGQAIGAITLGINVEKLN